MPFRFLRASCSAVAFVFAASNAGVAAQDVPARNVAVAVPSVDAAAGMLFASDSFAEAESPPFAWQTVGAACLTAGSAAAPGQSIPACGARSVAAAPGAGALQLTGGTPNARGAIVYRAALPTASGLRIGFDAASFGGTNPGGDGLTVFLSDADGGVPLRAGRSGGALGYAGGDGAPGIAHAYVAVAFDEYGNFSEAGPGRIGGAGRIPETIAVRGAASLGYQYIGGAANAAGGAASLPFTFDRPALEKRPASIPSIAVTLTAAGLLSVAIDRHDGAGSVTYYSQTIVGAGGQPAVPAKIYVGFTASTGASRSVHEITRFSVATIASAPATGPASSVTDFAAAQPPVPQAAFASPHGSGALAAAAAGNATPARQPASAVPAVDALPDPVQLRSANGALTLNAIASQTAAGTPQLTYNGSAAMPTLRLVPGDTLYVNLTNNLPAPPAGAGYLNDTSLHYHGLHVNPNAPSDDSIDMLAMPGQTLHYTIAIPPNHPPGLYWYHSHAHGEAERQNLSAMSGALIVDGIAAYAPQVVDLPERILIARDTVPAGQTLPAADRRQVAAMLWAMRHAVRANGAAANHRMSMASAVRGSTTAKTRDPYVVVNAWYKRLAVAAASTHCLAGEAEAPARNWTLNGQTNPTIGIRPGERQFWRLVNAGADTYLDFSVDNAPLQIVALDGVPLARYGSPALTVTHYLVPPASRLEFIITGPPAGTTAYVRTNCFDSGAAGLPMPAAILATIGTTSSFTDQAARRHRDRALSQAAQRAQRSYGPSLRGVMHRSYAAGASGPFGGAYPIVRSQTLVYSDQNQINGQSYDPAAPPAFYAQSGTMERWQIVNTSSQVHTFHIHQLHFLVQSIVGGTPIEQSNVGQVIDNINVPAATPNGPGSVTLVMDFTDPAIVGTFLLHCHILSHEDAGMMAKIHVGTAPPLATNVPAQGLTFASPSAPAQNAVVVGGQAPYSVSGCTNVANASVTAATVTVTPAGAGSCVLIVADATGLTASVAIAVTAPPAVLIVAPNALAFTSPAAPWQESAIAGGTPPYTVSGCPNIVSATVGGSALNVAPLLTGSCSLSVSDAAGNVQVVAVSVNAAAPAGYAADNDTFHNNAARQGWNQAETLLTTSNVAGPGFGKTNFLTGSGYGKVYAQPLFAANEPIGGTTHNLVIVATATDEVIAYDDRTLGILWERGFTNPGAGITQQSWTDTGCDDINPDMGIVGTPVIDRAEDRLYVVVPTDESGVSHLRLHAVSLQNGADAVPPVEVSASVMLAGNTGVASTDPRWNFNRSALLEANGSIYVALGSHCDFDNRNTHGWVLAYDASSLAPSGTVVNLTNAQSANYLGSPWMAGFGPAADSSGNVYFATGNGTWDGVNSFAMSDLKVPGNLDIGSGSYFTPATQAADSQADRDLGSGGVMLLPDGLSTTYPHLLIQGGKSGVKYILNRDNMGGMRAGDAGAVWQASIGGKEWGGPAFFQDTNGRSYVVYGDGGPLATYLFNPGSASLSVASSVIVPRGCLECRDAGSQPVVSSDGTNPGTAIVWALQTPGSRGGTLTLFAFNALTMQILYAAPAGTWFPGGGAGQISGALISPLVADGKVYVPTDGGVAVFGLTGSAADAARLRRAARKTH